jgi:hypothetical protein
MFPKAKDEPAVAAQSSVRVAIAAAIGFDFVTPPSGIRLRPGSVLRTPVPETAINENCHLRTRERDVGTPTRSRNASFDTIAEP